jgi:hypothetical protein
MPEGTGEVDAASAAPEPGGDHERLTAVDEAERLGADDECAVAVGEDYGYTVGEDGEQSAGEDDEQPAGEGYQVTDDQQPVGRGGEQASAPRQRPATGEPRVDEALARLDDLAGLPVTEHGDVFEHVHRRLREVLGELDPGSADTP